LLATELLRPGALPEGLETLQRAWWNVLDEAGRRLARLLAAAGEPLPPALAATLAGLPAETVRRLLQRWRPLLEQIDGQVALYHPSTRSFVAQQSGDGLAADHARYVALAYERSGGQPERLSADADGYLVRQLARHATLSDPATRS